MYVQLDLNWIRHPFPTGSFRIASTDQIDTLRELGLQNVRFVPARSDAAFQNPAAMENAPVDAPRDGPVGGPRDDSRAEAAVEQVAADLAASARHGAAQRLATLRTQQRALAACDQRFMAASRVCMRIQLGSDKAPKEARAQGESLVAQCVADLIGSGETVIRLLSEGVGERSVLHPVNVMVLSMLLARAQSSDAPALADIGLAALLHDMGKVHLPAHLWVRSQEMSAMDLLRYEKHVAESSAIGQRMGLSEAVLQAIAQHHERADGRGFPRGVSGDAISHGARIVALVNHYDRLCNPVHSALALTPHEALSVIFAQHKARFDSEVLAAFIRMMGVYPPGSIVQLVNGQFAMVVSVNSSRPLRPSVIVHDPQVPKEEALILDLECAPELGIRSSLKPGQLPRASLDYLSPRSRICYFFERAVADNAVERSA